MFIQKEFNWVYEESYACYVCRYGIWVFTIYVPDFSGKSCPSFRADERKSCEIYITKNSRYAFKDSKENLELAKSFCETFIDVY